MIRLLARFFTALLAAIASLIVTPVARADVADSCATTAERGFALRQSGRFLEALDKLTQCAREECPRLVKNDCRTGLGELKENAPRIAVRVRDEKGADLIPMSVVLDSTVLSSFEQANGRIVDPGPHVVKIETAHTSLREQSVMVLATDKVRTVEFVVEAAPPVQTGGVSLRPALREPALVADRRGAWAAGAVGVGFLATAGILGGWAILEHRSLQSSCGTNCFRPEAEVAHARAIVADAALGAAVVSFGVATILWLTAPRPERTSTTARR